jgi:SAM-dependent methyltransferase
MSRLNLNHGAPHLLDLGGGAGALFSRALLEGNRSARATQADWPQINALARQGLAQGDLSERFETIDGDFHLADLGSDRFDVAVVSHIIHQESPRSNLAILRRIHAALRPGGHIVIVDWILDDGRTGPASALLFNLTMLLLSEEGKSYERQELADLLQDGGFDTPSYSDTGDMSTMVIAARR